MTATKVVMIADTTTTTTVDSINCGLVGQDTFFISTTTSLENCLIFPIIINSHKKQQNSQKTIKLIRRDSNKRITKQFSTGGRT